MVPQLPAQWTALAQSSAKKQAGGQGCIFVQALKAPNLIMNNSESIDSDKLSNANQEIESNGDDDDVTKQILTPEEVTIESQDGEQQLSKELGVENEPAKSQNGPFFKKLALVGFVAVVLLGVVTADQLVKRFWEKESKKGDKVKEENDDTIKFAAMNKVRLTPEEKYKMKLLEEQRQRQVEAQDVELPDTGDVYDPEAEEIRMLQQLKHKESKFKFVFKFMGSETGAFTKVIARRLFELVNVGLLIVFSVLLVRIISNPDLASGATVSFDSPFTGLSTLEKVVYGGLAALSIYQCFCKVYSPSWLSYIPNSIVKVIAMVRSRLAHVQDNFAYIFSSLHPRNWSKSLSLTLEHAWKNSYSRKAFRHVFPEGTWKSVSKYLRMNYGHLVYAPLWLGLLLGFHMLYLYNPTALVSIVERVVPWVVPDTIVSGLVTPIATFAGSLAASQPIFATVGTWLFVSFGIGSLVRPWSYKKRDKSTVKPSDYYTSNTFAKVLHIIAGSICLALVLLFYVPSLHSLVQMLTGLPLESAISSAYLSVRAVLWVGLQTAAVSCKWIIDLMYSLQWPSNTGYIPFLFTMVWGSISVFAMYAIPKVANFIIDRKELWKRCKGADDDKKKERLKDLKKIVLAVYLVICVLICLPILLNIVFQLINTLISWSPFQLPIIMNIPLFSWVTRNVFVMFPLLLVPPYMFLFALQFNWIVPYKTFKYKEEKFKQKRWYKKIWPTIKHWLRPALIVLALIVISILYYALVSFIFHPESMTSLFALLDSIVLGPYGMKSFVMWIVTSLTKNMAWVGPYSLTFLVAGTFSFLLVFMPTFLDSKIGFLLYLPALHFVGQFLFMWSSMYLGTYDLIATVPPAALIGLLGAFHILTLLGLVFRGFFKKYNHPFVKRLVPWMDEYRDLVADY